MLHTNYYNYINELKILESMRELKFVLSNRLIAILSTINHEISDALLDAHNDLEHSSKQTFIDIDDEKDDVFTFIQSAKAAELLNVTQEDFEKDNTLVTYLRDDIKPDNDVYKKLRSPMKIGRLINSIFPNKFIASLRTENETKPKDVESFVRLYKATFKQEDKFELFETVEGDDIATWYNNEKYADDGGSLGGSCMGDMDDDSTFDIYTENPETVKMLLLYENSDKETIRGRALLWTLTEPADRVYMERIYINNSTDEQLYIEYAKAHDWLYKASQSYGVEFSIVDPKTHVTARIKLTAEVGSGEYDRYPYLDTLQYYNYTTGILSNKPSNADYQLVSTEGGYDDIEGQYEMVFSNYHDEEINKGDAVWCKFGEDWIYSNDARRVFNSGEGQNYATPDYEDIRHSHIEGIINKYFPTEKVVWSEYLKTYVFKWSAINVYLDAEKTDFVIDYKKRDDDSFVLVGEDYFKPELTEEDDNGKNILKK